MILLKFTIKTSILQNEIATAIKATSPKVLIPILTGILFEVEDKKLTLTASDSTIIIKTETIDPTLHVIEPGRIVISAKLINDIIRKIDDQFVTIEKIDSNIIHIFTEKVEFHINDFNIEEFPLIKIQHDDHEVNIPSNEIKKLIENTLFATAVNESRPQLTGINVVNQEGFVTFTATDTFRLSQSKYKLNNQFMFKNIIIPHRSAIELLKMLKDDDSPVTLSINETKMTLIMNQTIFQSKLLDGQYPDVFTLIPKIFEKKLTLNKSDLFHALDRTSLLVTEQNNKIVNMRLLEDQTLEFTSVSQEVGKVKEILKPIAIEQIEELKIAFNARYIIECLRVFESSEIELYYYGELKPMIIKSKENSELIQMILPVKTY